MTGVVLLLVSETTTIVFDVLLRLLRSQPKRQNLLASFLGVSHHPSWCAGRLWHHPPPKDEPLVLISLMMMAPLICVRFETIGYGIIEQIGPVNLQTIVFCSV